jgi:hypothetical protein
MHSKIRAKIRTNALLPMQLRSLDEYW